MRGQSTAQAQTPGVAAGRGRLFGLVLAVLAAATLLLTSQALPAHAGQATLTASQNPVKFMIGDNTKPVTINWNLGGMPKGTLVIQEQNGPTLVTQTVTTQIGSKSITATYGKSYLVRLFDGIEAANVVAFLQITTERANVRIDGLLDVITASTTPHGTYTEFKIGSLQPMQFVLEASTQAPNAQGVFASVDSGTFSWGKKTDWPTHLLNLQPDTTYHYVVKGTAEDGGVSMKAGTFKTLRRQIKVKVADISMSDDSDDQGDCECSFAFMMNGDGPKQWSHQDFATGQTKHPNVEFVQVSKAGYVAVGATGFDNDESCPLSLCVCGTGGVSYGIGNGENDCGEWSSVNKTMSITEKNLNEEHTQSWEMTANGGGGSSLRFKVSGTYQISYVP